MQHLLIAGFVVSAMLGFIAAYHLNTKYHLYKYPYLRTYGLHVLMLNLIVILLTVSGYIKVNILSTTADIRMRSVYEGLSLIRKGIEYLGVIVIAYTLVATMLQIQNKSMKRSMKNIFISISVLSAFALGIGLSSFLITREDIWLNLFCDIIWGAVILFVTVIFVFSLSEKQTGGRHRQPSLSRFLYFYIAAFSAFFLQNLFRFEYQDVFILMIILSLSLFPIFWSRYKLRMEASNGLPSNLDPEILKRFAAEYHISDREREVFEYILRGYSNREIQNRLFISPHTVKNHNYNLYKKLGVGNRTELMRKAFEYQNL